MEPLSSLEELTQALRCLPSVGPKAAQRMALHLLQHDREGAQRLALALDAATRTVRHCQRCNTFTEDELCALCRSTKRDATLLCVVETPADLMMVEHTQAYAGLYFVLMGRLSPLDGIGPKEIRLDRLLSERSMERSARSCWRPISPTRARQPRITSPSCLPRATSEVTRLARGVPVGGELEYVDSGTLAQALRERRVLTS